MPGLAKRMCLRRPFHGENFADMALDLTSFDQRCHLLEYGEQILGKHDACSAHAKFIRSFIRWESNSTYQYPAGFKRLPRPFQYLSTNAVVDYIHIFDEFFKIRSRIIDN